MGFGSSRDKREKERGSAPILGGALYAKRREDLKVELVLQKIAAGTRKGYDASWRKWCLYREAQGKGVFLECRSRTERLDDEDALMDYVVFLTGTMEAHHGSITQQIFAVRCADGRRLRRDRDGFCRHNLFRKGQCMGRRLIVGFWRSCASRWNKIWLC